MTIILTQPQIDYLRKFDNTGHGIPGATNTRNALLARGCLYMDGMGKVSITAYGTKAAREAVTERPSLEEAFSDVTKAFNKLEKHHFDKGYQAALDQERLTTLEAAFLTGLLSKALEDPLIRGFQKGMPERLYAKVSAIGFPGKDTE